MFERGFSLCDRSVERLPIKSRDGQGKKAQGQNFLTQCFPNRLKAKQQGLLSTSMLGSLDSLGSNLWILRLVNLSLEFFQTCFLPEIGWFLLQILYSEAYDGLGRLPTRFLGVVTPP